MYTEFPVAYVPKRRFSSQGACNDSSISNRLICFFVNSNAEKKIAFTTQLRLIDTPRPGRTSVWFRTKGASLTRVLTSIHPFVEELDFRHLGVVFVMSQTISLVDALR